MTTQTPIRVTKAPELDMEQLRDGLTNATAGGARELDAIHDAWWAAEHDDGEHPAMSAWEKVVDAAIAEIAPDVAKMLQAAIERRLPWTYDDR